MVPPDLDVQRLRVMQYDSLDAPVRELIQEYGMNKTFNALQQVGGYLEQARYYLEDTVGPPLVPKRRRR